MRASMSGCFVRNLPPAGTAVQGKMSVYPGGFEVSRQQVLKCGGRTMVLCWIDKAKLMSAVVKNGSVEILLAGRQADGRTIFGKDRVMVMK